MPVPVIENIAEEIKDRINEITEANGWNQNLVALRPKRLVFKDESPIDGTVLIWQGSEGRPEKEFDGCESWEQEFLLEAGVIDSDSATTSIDTRINQVRADIQKKLKEDNSRGGNAVQTKFKGSWKFDDGKGFSGIAVHLVVHYRTLFDDPYTAA